MLFKKGIVRKTFLFSSLLILLVIIVSFATLYLMMPRFYYQWKVNTLRDNLNVLTQKLKQAPDYETAAPQVQAFSEANNVTLMAFDKDENILAEISTPFIGMRDAGGTFRISGRQAGEDNGRALYDLFIESRGDVRIADIAGAMEGATSAGGASAGSTAAGSASTGGANSIYYATSADSAASANVAVSVAETGTRHDNSSDIRIEDRAMPTDGGASAGSASSGGASTGGANSIYYAAPADDAAHSAGAGSIPEKRPPPGGNADALKPDDALTQIMLMDPREAPIAQYSQQSEKDGVMVRWTIGTGPINSISMEERVDSALIGVIRVRGALQPIDEAKGVILSLLPYVLGAAIILGLFLSGVFANRVSKPLLTISDAALRMQAMNAGVKSGIRTDDELGQLSLNLDALYETLLNNIENLRAEMDEVNRLERSKTEMMQSASHELKTPVAALSGMLEGMIDNIGIYRDKEKYLIECKTEVDKLASLVGEILEASKQDAPGFEPACVTVDAGGIINSALSDFERDIAAKRLTLEKTVENAKISTDPAVFHRIISNLLSNAIRYSPERGVISVSLSPAANGGDGSGCGSSGSSGSGSDGGSSGSGCGNSSSGGMWMLAIRNDCAEPIADGELEKLVEPFYTRNFSRDRDKSGTGLGLYIVRQALERLQIGYRLEYSDNRFGFIMDLTVQ